MAKHDLQKVIKIGDELFRTQGYCNTGTEEILDKAKFPRSSFYYHFKNKDGFAVKVIERYGQDSVKMYKSILENKEIGSPLERFKIFFDMLGDLSQKKDFKSLCLVQKMSGECATIEPIRKAADKQLADMLAVFENCIQEGQTLGEFRDDVQAKALAQFLHAQLYGANTLVRLSHDREQLDSCLNLALDYLRK